MRLTLTAAGITLLEIVLLERDEDDSEDPATASTATSTSERAEGAPPYGFRPSQDPVPWEDR
jgi:hypothetical protein